MVNRRVVSVVVSGTLTNLTSASSVSVAPDTVIFLESNGYVPVIFESVSTNMTLQATGTLDSMTPARPTIFTSWEPPIMSQEELSALPTFLAESVLIGGHVRLPVNIRVPISASGIWSIVGIPASSGTAFMNAVGSFVLMGDENKRTRLVLNPTNPSAYTLDNALTYVETTASASFSLTFQVLCAFDQTLSGQITPLEARIALATDITYIPYAILNSLYTEFGLLGTFVMDNRSLYILVNDGDIDSFPTITLSINSVVLALYPQDYLVPLSGGEPGRTRYSLMLGGHPDRIIRLGRHIMGKFAIHVDPANNRIGFGESI